MSAPVSEASLRAALVERLEASHIEIIDDSGGCGQAFSATIVSPRFEGKRALQRARLVNEALKEEIASIHAWSAKCRTPAEWAEDQQKGAGGGDGEAEGEGTGRQEGKMADTAPPSGQ